MGFRDIVQECNQCSGTGIKSGQDGAEVGSCTFCDGVGEIGVYKLSTAYKTAMQGLADKIDLILEAVT